MKKLLSAQIFAAVSLAVAFPLAASANSFAQERAFNYLHEPLEIQSSNAAAEHISPSSVNVGGGQSDATSTSLERGQSGDDAAKDEVHRQHARNTLDPLEPGYVWWQ